MRHLTALGLLLVGVAGGVAAVALHSRPWGLALAVAGSLAGLVLAPRGLRRTAYAAGWLLVLGLVVRGRPEGDYLVADDLAGYLLVGLGLVFVVATIATLPRPSGLASR